MGRSGARNLRRMWPTRKQLKQTFHSMEAWFLRSRCQYSWFWFLELLPDLFLWPELLLVCLEVPLLFCASCYELLTSRYWMLDWHAVDDHNLLRIELTLNSSYHFGLASYCECRNHEVFALHFFCWSRIDFLFDAWNHSCSNFGRKSCTVSSLVPQNSFSDCPKTSNFWFGFLVFWPVRRQYPSENSLLRFSWHQWSFKCKMRHCFDAPVRGNIRAQKPQLGIHRPSTVLFFSVPTVVWSSSNPQWP